VQKTGYLKGSSYGTMLFRTIVASELKHSSAQRPCLDNFGIPRIAPHFLRGSATLSAQWFAPRHIRESIPTALNIERNSRHGKRSGLEAHLGRLADGYCSVVVLQSHLPSAALPYTLFLRFAVAEPVAVVLAAPGNPSDTVPFSKVTSSLGSGGTCHQGIR